MKSKTTLVGWLTGSVVLLAAGTTSADPHTHDGFFFRGEVGVAYVSSSGTLKDNGSSTNMTVKGTGAGLGFFFGGTPAPGVVVGGALLGSDAVSPTVTMNDRTGTADNSALVLVLVGPFLQYYPFPSEGLNLGLAVGFATLSAQNKDGNTEGQDNGFGASLSIGQDFWVGKEWSLGIAGRFSYARVSATTGAFTETANALFLMALFTFTYH